MPGRGQAEGGQTVADPAREAPAGLSLEPQGRPQRSLHTIDAVALIVGTVVGAMIFRVPSLVAGALPSEGAFLLVWVAGGLASFVGALCYAELATSFPSAGGDYHFLRRAFGPQLSFVYAWARVTVIQAGSIALLAYVLGDYIAELLGQTGPASSAVWAALSICLVTALNLVGVRQGLWAQRLLSLAKVLGLGTVVVVGLLWANHLDSPARPPSSQGGGGLGFAMVMVLLTYGGWNEAAYVSAELPNVRRSMVPALFWGIGTITLLYLLTNLAYLRVLGLGGVAASDAVAVELARAVGGDGAAVVLGVLVALCVLGALSATIFTGARTCYAMGVDHPRLAGLGQWREDRDTPARGFVLQAGLALGLVALGMLARGGVQAMVDYTAPVFWLFFLLVGVSLMVLRRRERGIQRPFRVPLYPVVPLAFCLLCAYMLWSSIAYAVGQVRVGDPVSAVPVAVGLLVMAAGVPLARGASRAGPQPEGDYGAAGGTEPPPIDPALTRVNEEWSE